MLPMVLATATKITALATSARETAMAAATATVAVAAAAVAFVVSVVVLSKWSTLSNGRFVSEDGTRTRFFLSNQSEQISR